MEATSSKTSPLGLIHVYTGHGKGKTTAALGLALRASGCGLNVAVVQFMKSGNCGEIAALQHLPGISAYSYGTTSLLTKGLPPDDESCQLAAAAMAKATELMQKSSTDLLILDELSLAVYFELISEQEAMQLLHCKPQQLELVITGRNMPQCLLDAADYLTEMQEIKHPYNKGIPGRRGIEF